MARSLCAKCSQRKKENKWLPRAVADWREVILPRICEFRCDDNDPKYAIFSNVAYNLQYLEYLNRCFEEQYLTSVIRASLIKTFTLTTAQIIECLLYIKLLEMKVNKDDIWEFSQAIRVAEQKNAYALGVVFYRREIKRLKDLRNKIHLQSSKDIAEADYAVFENVKLLNEVKQILWQFLQKSLKIPTDKMNQLFYFLLPTKKFVHSN